MPQKTNDTATKQNQKRSLEHRIRLTAMILFIAAICFWFYWIYQATTYAFEISWTDRLLRWRIVENHMEITLPIRIALFSLWLIVIALGSAAFYFGLRLLYCMRSGEYFQESTCRAIKYFGMFLVLAMVGDTVFASLDHVIATWNNTGESLVTDKGLSMGRPFIGPRFEYDPGDISLALCGVGFWLIGWVFQEGFRLQKENESFV